MIYIISLHVFITHLFFNFSDMSISDIRSFKNFFVKRGKVSKSHFPSKSVCKEAFQRKPNEKLKY